MKPKTMILLGLAITCGLGASYMTSRLLADRGTQTQETVKILRAKRPLNIGEAIRNPQEMFEEVQVAKDQDTPEAIREFDALKDKVLKQSRNKGDAITPASLLGKNETLDIPDGYVAVGLRTNMECSASGFATLPGSRVDLIWFQRGQNNETSRTDVLLEDVFVLAADGKLDREGLTAVAQVVTLALTPEEQIKVNLAKETGIINLALRKHGDKGKRNIKGMTGQDLRDFLAGVQKGFPASGEPSAKEDTPPVEVKKAPTVVPQIADKPATQQPQTVEQPKVVERPKTVKDEVTLVNGSKKIRIVREYAEDGTLVSESRHESEVNAAPQPPQPAVPQAPAPAPAGDKKGTNTLDV